MSKALTKIHRKSLIYTLLLAFLFCSCSQPNVKERSTEYVLDEFGRSVKIIDIDSCEYLFYERGHAMIMAHKGNCKYCEKRSIEKH